MGNRTLTFERAFKLFTRALANPTGRRLGPTTAEVDMSAGCESPVVVEYVGRRETFILRRHVTDFEGPAFSRPDQWESVSVIIHCKCRQCDTCLRKRRQHWWFRAKHETALAPRTWFATLTFNDQALFKCELEAKRNALRRGVDFDTLSEDAKRKRILDRAGADVTLWFKRLRKSSGVPLRYLVVSEYGGEHGRLHFHALIHEVQIHKHVKYDLLRKQWRCGFSTFKLADPKAPSYVAKYISKDAAARVRASQRYGSDTAYAIVDTRGTSVAREE